MAQQSNREKSARWPVYLVIALFIAVTALFLIEFVVSTEDEMTVVPQPTVELSAETYVDRVSSLLASASPERGAKLVELYICTACHRDGVASKIAPAFAGVGERATTRRPPLTAPAYIYESITNPRAYTVEGFNPVMPQDFSMRLSDQELGDIIAYLLTPDAH